MEQIVEKPAAESAETSELKQLLANDEVKIPKPGELIKGKIIAVSKAEVRLDIDGLTTGVVRGREFFDESDQYRDLKVGDEVEATVIELENENGEMELSFRFAGHQRAWDQLTVLQREGTPLEVVVTEANKGGLMTRVGSVLGFLPVSQLSPEHYPRVPGGDKAKILERLRLLAGTRLLVKVIDVNETEGKLIVSEKAAWEEKQKDVLARYRVGDMVTGKVTAVTDFGVFLEFGEHLEGLVHISELAWQRIDKPGDLFQLGQEMSAKIINIQGSKIFLSAKQLVDDPWKSITDRYQVGQVVKGKVLKINPFGLFVELDEKIHGLAHVSELSDAPLADINKAATIGDELEFKIISIEPKNHRLGLSRRKLHEPMPVPDAAKTEAAAPAPTEGSAPVQEPGA
ncbi:MAG: S1 RNA-binding domain-containing protein [bacterium]|nr:S1 RNA-binding domain-containing protein [bacterium]